MQRRPPHRHNGQHNGRQTANLTRTQPRMEAKSKVLTLLMRARRWGMRPGPREPQALAVRPNRSCWWIEARRSRSQQGRGTLCLHAQRKWSAPLSCGRFQIPRSCSSFWQRIRAPSALCGDRRVSRGVRCLLSAGKECLTASLTSGDAASATSESFLGVAVAELISRRRQWPTLRSFDTAVGLSRNGCSLRSSAYLREAYHELSKEDVLPDATTALGSVSTLRKAVVLYLSLVIADLPSTITRCRRCLCPDGSYATICFDGLQLGYQLRFMLAFLRSAVSVSPIAGASVYALLIRDAALAKALDSFMRVAVPSVCNTIATMTAMRGTVMAFVVLTGYVHVNAAEKTFAGSTLQPIGRCKERGWDPVEDGGTKPELIAFIRGFFACRRAARGVAMDIIGGPVDLRCRVPSALMVAVKSTAADLSDDAADIAGGASRATQRQTVARQTMKEKTLSNGPPWRHGMVWQAMGTGLTAVMAQRSWRKSSGDAPVPAPSRGVGPRRTAADVRPEVLRASAG